MRLIFAGTPQFSVPPLQALIDQKHEIVGVYTQPDKKTGRGQKLTFPPVKQLALQYDLPIFQPITLKTQEALDTLKNLNADAMIVVAYGMILPENILNTPRLGCLNIHASLLPRWRGAAPIQRAIQAGDPETGVCIMQMDVGLDTGDVLYEAKLPILATDTSSSLHDKLSILGAKSLLNTLENLTELKKTAIKQTDSDSTYAKKISKAESHIDWNNTAEQIDSSIRAFNPWPICESKLWGKRVRIWNSSLGNKIPNNKEPGTILSISKSGIEVSCGVGSVLLKTLQKDGSKPLPAHEFINGFDSALSKETISTSTLKFINE